MRVFALSDLHADYQDNLLWVENLSRSEYVRDTLLLAGDVSHDRNVFAGVLAALRSRFAQVFFVPGNHDLWLRSRDSGDSITKHGDIIRCCESLDVRTTAGIARDSENDRGVWIVPLEAWYARPGEDPEESLFVPKPGEDPSLRMWVDDRAIRWPVFESGATAARYFLERNKPLLEAGGDGPVISFSHFLPRRELIFPTVEELQAMGFPLKDPQPKFNFSRVAGCTGLDRQIRRLGSVLHVYGHQHRNRVRQIDGVTYVSHCLGYPRERAEGRISKSLCEPLLVWDTDADGPAAAVT